MSRSSFVGSFVLLKPVQRDAMYALYAFARITDDLADQVSSKSLCRECLKLWRRKAEAELGPSNSASADMVTLGSVESREIVDRYQPMWPALRQSSEVFQIPFQLIDDIIAGVEMDLDFQQPADWSELEKYCYHVASAVGLACCHIWGCESAMPTESAVACGIAFQLTNILRDVREDAKLDRIYIPASLMDEYQVDRASWISGQPSGRWKEMVQAMVASAERYYGEGWQTIHAVSPGGQRMFSLMFRSYYDLLLKIKGDPEAIWERRIRLSKRQKFGLTVSHFFNPFYRRLTPPQLVGVAPIRADLVSR